MVTLRIILVVAISLCYGVGVCVGYHSCKDLKLHNPSVPNGEYLLWNGNGETFIAYCEFQGDHGYMFIPKNVAGVSINMAKIVPSTSEVLIRHRRSDGKQYDTVMKQISAKSSVPLSIQYNRSTGYARPQNHATLGPYLYLGFLPTSIAGQRSVQGYRANDADFTFKNCDANPNSYLAFFFNSRNQQPTNYHQRCCYAALMRNWIIVGHAAATNLPVKFFFKFEMHMGGCGGYAINEYNTLSDIVGAALGMRFDLTCP